MTGYKNGKAVTQVTEILFDMRMYKEDEIRAALKKYDAENPVKKKKRGR